MVTLDRIAGAKRRFAADERASNAIEFALLSPLVLAFVFLVAYLGIYIGIAHSLAQMAADASRYAMVGLDASERQTLARQWVSRSSRDYSLIDGKHLRVTTSESDGALRVTLNYSVVYLPTPPIIGALVSLPADLQRSSLVVVQ